MTSESVETSVEPLPTTRREAVADVLRVATEGAARYAVILVVLICLFAFFAATQDNFLTKQNIENIFTGVAILWIVALGQTFVVLTAGVDLSVGAMLALLGFVLVKIMNAGVPSPLAMLATIAAGAMIGAGLNGFLIGRVGLSFFVVTLGTMALFHGSLSLWSGVETDYTDSSLVETIGIGDLGGVPVPIWIMLGTFAIAFYVLRFTYFGRDVYAVGGNIQAARLSGIHVSRTLMAVYGITGAAAAVGTIIQVGRLGAASPIVGSDLPLTSAAGVLLGGTSFVGGIGGVVGTAVGVLFIGTLQNGLGIAGVSAFWQEVVTGAILILAILIDRLREHSGGFRRRRQLESEGRG
jgi:ribose transport system permease protein